MRSITLIFLALILSSFSESIPYGPNQCLALMDGEKLVDTTKPMVDYYDPFHGVKTYQVPIHKSVKGRGYSTFFGIGVGFDAEASLLYDAYMESDDYEIIDSKKTTDRSTGMTAYQILSKKDGLYNHKYFFTIAAPLMTLVVNDISENSDVIKALYKDPEYTTKRRQCEK